MNELVSLLCLILGFGQLEGGSEMSPAFPYWGKDLDDYGQGCVGLMDQLSIVET